MSTPKVARVARFVIDGTNATYQGLFATVARNAPANVVHTTHRAAMSVTRSAAPNGPIPGQTVIPANRLDNVRGVFATAAQVQQHRADINATSKAYKEAYTILTQSKKVIGF